MKSKVIFQFKDGQTFEYSHRNNAPQNSLVCGLDALSSHLQVERHKATDNVAKIIIDFEVSE